MSWHFIDTWHVFTITGIAPYLSLPEKYYVPQVISGFESLDVLISIFMILRHLKSDTAKVENEHAPVVKPEGNILPWQLMDTVFEPSGKK